MRVKVCVFVIISILLTVFICTACQPTPENEAVINKNDNVWETAIQNPASISEQTGEHLETWEKTIEAGSAAVEINADIVVSTTTCAVLKVIERDFRQDDVNRAIEVFADDAEISNFNASTKSRIEAEILEYRQCIAEIEAENYYSDDGMSAEEQIEEFESYIEELKREYADAPDSTVVEEAVNTSMVKDNYSEAVKLFFINEENEEKTLSIRNFPEENSTIMQYMDADTHAASYAEFEKDELAKATDELPEIEEVNEYLSAYFNDLEIGACSMQQYQILCQEKAGEKNPIYVLTYSRNYGNGDVSLIKQRTSPLSSNTEAVEYALPHEPETIEIITDGKRIYTFNWSQPHKVLGEVNTSVALIDVEQAKSLLEQQITRVIKGENRDQQIFINQVKLSFFYLRSQNDNALQIVPVWDLIGVELSENSESDVMSFVTINAIDGSVLNRELGY